MKKSIAIGIFILALPFVGYAQGVPPGRPFQGLFGGNGGGGALIENLGFAVPGETVYSGSHIEKTLNESETQIPIPRDGQLVSLAVNPFDNQLDNDVVFTVMLNGQATALKITVPGEDETVISFTPDAVVPVKAGDLVSLQTDTTGANGIIIRFRASYVLELE